MTDPIPHERPDSDQEGSLGDLAENAGSMFENLKSQLEQVWNQILVAAQQWLNEMGWDIDLGVDVLPEETSPTLEITIDSDGRAYVMNVENSDRIEVRPDIDSNGDGRVDDEELSAYEQSESLNHIYVRAAMVARIQEARAAASAGLRDSRVSDVLDMNYDDQVSAGQEAVEGPHRTRWRAVGPNGHRLITGAMPGRTSEVQNFDEDRATRDFIALYNAGVRHVLHVGGDQDEVRDFYRDLERQYPDVYFDVRPYPREPGSAAAMLRELYREASGDGYTYITCTNNAHRAPSTALLLAAANRPRRSGQSVQEYFEELCAMNDLNPGYLDADYGIWLKDLIFEIIGDNHHLDYIAGRVNSYERPRNV